MKVQLFAGQETSIARRGWFFRLLTAATDLNVRITRSTDGKQFYNGVLSSGIGIDFLSNAAAFGNEPFDTIYLKADSDQLVDLWIEEVKADDDRLSGNFDINAALTVSQNLPKYSTYQEILVAPGAEILTNRPSRRWAKVSVNGQAYTYLFSNGYLNGVNQDFSFEWLTSQELINDSTGNRTYEVWETYD